MTARLAWVALVFAQLSLFAVGGANAVIPSMEHHFVDAPRFAAAIDGSTFASLIALAQAAPGPNAMVVGLVGWHVAGAAGALVATLAFCGPPALMTLVVGRAWARLQATGVGATIVKGVAPLTIGLVLASGWSLARAQGFHTVPVVITTLAAVGALWRPAAGLWLLALGAGVAVVAA